MEVKAAIIVRLSILVSTIILAFDSIGYKKKKMKKKSMDLISEESWGINMKIPGIKEKFRLRKFRFWKTRGDDIGSPHKNQIRKQIECVDLSMFP